ncbi:hypothetical protein O4H61_15705 [Roseovarius aestuarii]|nr:hypothetical protein [Roseovarius aestuarii]
MHLRYIVVEPDLFVSEDLCDILRTADKDANVVAATTLSIACGILSDGGRVDMVFLNGKVAQTQDETFLSLVQNHGALMVRIGGRAPLNEDVTLAEICVPAPFTNEAIMGLLRERRRLAPGEM